MMIAGRLAVSIRSAGLGKPTFLACSGFVVNGAMIMLLDGIFWNLRLSRKSDMLLHLGLV
jgi:hypothetical protein